jgi:hypothetical protein
MRWAGFLFVLSLVVFSGCGHGKRRIDIDVSNVSIPAVKIHRYDIDLFKVNPDYLQRDLESLKPEYRFFLDTDLSDPSKLSEMNGYLASQRNKQFNAAVESQFRDITQIEEDLTLALKHFVYYFPDAKLPRVYAYISGGDYEYPVQFADSVLLIGLDNYLGRDFKPYLADGLPLYRISRMTSSHVIPDCMKVFGRITYPDQEPGNTLLEQMTAAGKRLLFLDAMMPQTEDRLKIGFTKEQYEWILKNESQVWAAIIANRMLYSTDRRLIRSFMADGPFTAEFSKDAPARLGEWIGWQIVRNYFEDHPNVSLPGIMLEKDAQKILTLSGYKPEK